VSASNALLVNGTAVITSNGAQSISTTGNISAEYFTGNGSQLAGVGTPLTVSQYTTGNISNTISNITGKLRRHIVTLTKCILLLPCSTKL
jgi:hypothetical protein